MVADAAMLLDVSRSMCHATFRAVNSGVNHRRVRREVSETEKFVTEFCQKAANKAMQVMCGIGYTNTSPIERIVRDLRLVSIWTGTKEVMSSIIEYEWYRNCFAKKQGTSGCVMEEIAGQADAPEEKVCQ